MKIFGSWKELVSLVFRKDGQEVTLRPNQSTTYTADRDVQIPPGDTAHVLTSATSTQTLTNKTIDGDNNTVQDLPLTAIKTALADADKVLLRDNAGVPTSNTISNVHVSPSAGIAYSKLSVPDNSIPEAKLTTVLVDANKVLTRDAAGVPVSSLVSNVNVSPTAAIAYSKLNVADGDLTIAKTSGLQAALDAQDALSELADVDLTTLPQDDDSLVYNSTLSRWVAVASGGNGEINAIVKPNTAIGWEASGAGITVATTTTSSELPLSPIIKSGIRITPVSGTDYVRHRFTMPVSLKHTKLKLEFYQRALSGYTSGNIKVELYKNAASNYSGVYTKFSLSTDVLGDSSLPSATDKFTAYVDTDSADYYELRFVRVSGTSAIVVTNVIVGPGIQANSAIVGQLVPWTPSTTWTTNATWSGNYRQVGQLVEYFVEGSFTGATSTGVQLEMDLPSGHVISTSLLKGALALSVISSSGSIFNGSTAVHRLSVVPLDSDTVRIVYANTAPDQLAGLDAASLPITVGAGSTIRFEFKLPIVAFEGAGTINVNTPDVEYIYNTNTTDTDNSTSFGYGAEGTQFAAFTAQRFQRVRSKYPIGPSDKIVLELSTNSGASWTSYEQGSLISPRTIQNSVNYGAFISPVNATDIDVYFADYRATLGATYGSAGSPWSDIDNDPQYKWRVAIHRGPSPVGFNTVTQAQSGLVKRAGQLLGTNTNDSAEAGFVGEYVEFIQTSPITLTTNVASNIATMSLTAGDWDVWAVSSFDTNGTLVSQVLSVDTGISTVSVTPPSFPGQWFNQTLPAYNSASFGLFYVSSPVSRVSFASTSNVYCVGISLFTAGAGALRAFSTKLMARRVR